MTKKNASLVQQRGRHETACRDVGSGGKERRDGGGGEVEAVVGVGGVLQPPGGGYNR